MFEDPHCTIAIERPYPELDDGRFPIKREVGDVVEVEVDIYKDGHEGLLAAVLFRQVGASEWSESPLRLDDNDRWRGSFKVEQLGRYEYTFEAWVDRYGSWLDEVKKKLAAGESVTSELLEGRQLLEAAADRAQGWHRGRIEGFLATWDVKTRATELLVQASDGGWLAFMREAEDRSRSTRYDRILEVVVDPVIARFGAWYELFPRSQGTVPGRSATFSECAKRVPEIRSMGFDVIYVPPIHPIGLTNRKGKNNARVCKAGDPGSPYAIGSKDGGHMAVEPTLGTLADFEAFVGVCEDHGIKVALDFAIQCSPDHPYLTEHPAWFAKRPDGTIKYAENPPKKYEDIHHLDFGTEDWRSLWNEMAKIIEFWISHGVRIFRVDNPHTKPLPFWRWLISSTKERHPDVVFLAEAFTRPKMMRTLAKAGFSQSYTYFTWRNEKTELTEYVEELTQSKMKEYYRGNFFVNTPDILPFFLQTGGRPAFKIRAVLASTLSSSYGIYSGFELCENTAIAGREEYLNSEKYEFKVWDWNRPGNIKEFISKLNRARNDNPALQEYDNVKFHAANANDILVYSKSTPRRGNAVLTVVNLNPRQVRDSLVHVNPWDLGKGENEPYVVHDLISQQRWTWKGWTNYVRLDPHEEPAHLFVIE